MKMTVVRRKRTFPDPAPGRKEPHPLTIERWMENGTARATDGCRVELDGTCPHGHPSWLVQMGMV